MHLIFLTQVLPYPLDAGPKVRAYYVLRYLAQQHTVTLVSFVRETDTPAARVHLATYCRALHTVPMPRSKLRDGYHLLRSLVNGQPFIIARDWNYQMVAELQRVVANEGPFDAVHADQLWMAPYAELVRQWQSQPLRLVLDQHNAVFMIPERMAGDDPHPLKRLLLAMEARKLAHYEVETCQRFDHVTWVTAEDYAAVTAQANGHGPVPNAGIIPICGDVAGQAPIVRRAGPRRITFVGGLHYPPNAQGICWFAEKIFGQILAEAPDVILTVIGKQPPPQLHQLGIPAANLDVPGFVEELEPYLAETAVFVVPLLAGGGMRVKIIDAWRWGLPIVSTTIGAEGISANPGQHILIADTPTAFAQATLSLLHAPEWADTLAQNGRRWLEEAYDWRKVYQRWSTIYP
ncbi:MAG: glycosyltransferase [Caldilineaceae bacterium]|nr:glycosyltransferase [Caldilineaceae bacterium]